MEKRCTIQFILPGTSIDGFTMTISLPKFLKEGDVINLKSFVGLNNQQETEKKKEISKFDWEVDSIDHKPQYKVYLKTTRTNANGDIVYKDIIKP